MAGFKSKKKAAEDKLSDTAWPKIIQGSHSTRTEYEDGRIEFVTDWEALQRDVREAIASVESKTVEEKTKPKRTRKK